MKRSNLILAIASLLPALCGFAQETTTTMTTEERAKVIRWLKESQEGTISQVESLSDAQWNFKSAPNRWSVAECVEHIMMAEGLLFAQVDKAMASEPNPDWQTKTKGKAEFIENVMVKRMGKAQAPESIVPTGKLSRAELMKQLREARAKTLAFTESTQASLKDHTTEHIFPVFNTLNAYQWLIYIPLHNIRHNQQITEVIKHPDFPKQ